MSKNLFVVSSFWNLHYFGTIYTSGPITIQTFKGIGLNILVKHKMLKKMQNLKNNATKLVRMIQLSDPLETLYG